MRMETFLSAIKITYQIGVIKYKSGSLFIIQCSSSFFKTSKWDTE